MEIVPLCLLILASLLGSFANEDLRKKVLVFPKPSNNAAVFLKAEVQQPLTSFTVCLRYYTLLTRAYGLFSYATKQGDNDLLLYKPQPNQYRLYVGGSYVAFTLPEKKDSRPRWEHICTSWDSATGLVQLWVNGYPLPRMGLKKGYSINPEASIVLGQDQDQGFLGWVFDINTSFQGEMTDVYMWDRVLSTDEVNLAWNNQAVSNSLINWSSLDYEISYYVMIMPSLISADE